MAAGPVDADSTRTDWEAGGNALGSGLGETHASPDAARSALLQTQAHFGLAEDPAPTSIYEWRDGRQHLGGSGPTTLPARSPAGAPHGAHGAGGSAPGRSARARSNRSGGRRRGPHRLARGLVATVLVVVLLLFAALGGLLATTPGVADAPGLARAVVAANGGILTPLPPPARVAAALVATEDHAFYDPPGIDILYGAARAAYSAVTGRRELGGSTLAQQLAKLLYTGPHPGLSTKVRQVAIGLELEVRYTHAELLQMYLDAAYFGDGAYGVETASERYFGLPATRVSWGQAALLAGLVQAPSAYDPLRHLAAARRRQAEVLHQLVVTGVLTPAQAATAAAAPLGLR